MNGALTQFFIVQRNEKKQEIENKSINKVILNGCQIYLLLLPELFTLVAKII